MSQPRSLIVHLLCSSILLACAGSAGDGDGGGVCPDNGVAGCPCIDGGLCLLGLVCYDGLCLPPGGEPGETGTDAGSGKPIVDMGGGDESGMPGGSCEGTCGGQGSGDCWCDPSCVGLGDCCEDYEQACPGQCLSNTDCAADEVCSSSLQTCEGAYGWTYGVWVSSWSDYADVCWDVGDCAGPDPFYSLVLGGQTLFVSTSQADTLMAMWSEPAVMQIDGTATLFVRMWDEDISDHDWILDWGELDQQGVFVAPSTATLHQGYVIEECWEAPYAAGSGCYEIELRFVAQ
jgi:hypothetical protein